MTTPAITRGRGAVLAGVVLAGVVLASVAVAGVLMSTGDRTPGGHTASAGRRAVAPLAGGWRLSVYYTAVLSLHDGPTTEVRGCLVRDCADGDDVLGTYPASFARAVMEEGTGRIDRGPNAGRYLEWSDNIGYWLDTVPLDAHGQRLVPFVTAAADRRVLRRGAVFRVSGCGHQEGDALDAAVCTRIRSARWEVRDQFTPGLGGARHLDLYIGEERGRGFTDRSPFYFDVQGARIIRVR